MRSRSFLYSTIAIVLALLLLTAGGLTWFFGQNPKRLLKSAYGGSPASVMFVSSQAPLVASLLVNPEQVEAFQKTVATGDRRSAGMELAQLKRGLLAAFDLNYDQDIRPWLGDELTFAVTTADLDRNSQTGRQPGYLLVLSTKDTTQSGIFLDLFWQKQAVAGVNLVVEQYQGVKLIAGRSVVGELPAAPLPGDLNPPSPTLALPRNFNLVTATVGDRFILLANHPKVLREAINTLQANSLSLASTTRYQEAVRELNPDRIGFVFANVPQLKSWLTFDRGNALQPSKGSKPKPASSKTAVLIDTQVAQPPIEQVELAVAIGLERQGIQLDALLIRDQISTSEKPADHDPNLLPTLSQPVEAMAYLPANSLFSVASRDLNSLWLTFMALQDQGWPIGQLLKQSLSQLQQTWKIDPQQDILNWATGEYALAAIRHPDSSNRQEESITPIDWILVAERSPDAAPAIEHLDELAQQDGFSVGPLTIGQQQVSAWTKLTTNLKLDTPLNLQAQVRGVHTTMDRYELFTTSLEAMAQVLQAKGNSLLTSQDFQSAISLLPKPNGGYLYLNWPASETILAQRFPFLNLVRLAAKPWLAKFQGFTFTPYQPADPTTQGQGWKGELLIQLGESAA